MRRRTSLTVPFLFSLTVQPASAQAPLETGSPEAAFAGSPIRLSKEAAARLREHYHGDNVPLIPQPFRGRLDAALLMHDGSRIETVKTALNAANGMKTVLLWEQTRFIATGGVSIAALHARDLAATGASGLAETAAMLWLYAVATSFTDGRKCAGDAAPDAYLEMLRGPGFEPVTRIIRTLADDRLAAMRTLAIRLELVLSRDRSDDAICRTADGAAEIRPEADWRPAAATARTNLPKNLTALCTLMRSGPAARP